MDDRLAGLEVRHDDCGDRVLGLDLHRLPDQDSELSNKGLHDKAVRQVCGLDGTIEDVELQCLHITNCF